MQQPFPQPAEPSSTEIKPSETHVDKRYIDENMINVTSSNLFQEGFSKYFQNELFSDVTIHHVPTNRSYRCHRIILAQRSKFFENLFTTTFKDSEDCVYVNFEDTSEVFEQVLEYLYTGNITVSATSIVALHVAADQLICADLSKSIMDTLDGFLALENVFLFLKNSLKMYDDSILEKACAYVALNFTNLVEGFNEIYRELPAQVFFGILAHENLFKCKGSKLTKSNLVTECVKNYCAVNPIFEDEELLQLCVDALSLNENIRPDFVLPLISECERKGLAEPLSACIRVLALNFSDLIDIDVVLSLKPNAFKDLMSSDELFINSEDNVFDVVLKYLTLHQDLEPELKQNIAETIRLPYLSYKNLEKVFNKTVPEITNSISQEAVTTALIHRILKAERSPDLPIIAKPRTTRAFTYTSDFDDCGIIYWLGTAFSTDTYSSPIARNLLKIICSCGFEAGTEEDLIARTPVSCNMMNTPNTTVTFDFINITILPYAYTIRQTNARDSECMRNWRFQASNNGTTFDDISVHVNDATITTKSQSATFTVEGNDYYRYFRILQDGPNSSNNNYLSLAGFEIYGMIKH